MRLCPIASGSSGNCIYAGSDQTHLLIDTGISAKKIMEGLQFLDLSKESVQGILITHEHADHIRGLGVFLRKHMVPVYATRKTIEAIFQDESLGNIPKDMFFDIRPDVDFKLGDLMIHPFRISHDAADPVAYRISNGYQNVAVCTDLGFFDGYIIENLKNLNAMVLESNHDVNMLQMGPYPYSLKQRILSLHGHLSNESCGQLLCRIAHEQLKTVFLAHLSKENNYPELAFETVRMEINMSEIPFSAEDFQIIVAQRDVPSAPCIL